VSRFDLLKLLAEEVARLLSNCTTPMLLEMVLSCSELLLALPLVLLALKLIDAEVAFEILTANIQGKHRPYLSSKVSGVNTHR
jgi:hypothetical protein